jgi:hypothetical protein
MEYESPEVLASYSEEELIEEAAVCTGYGRPDIFRWFRNNH